MKLQAINCPTTPAGSFPPHHSQLLPPACTCTHARQGPSLLAFGFPALSQTIGPHKLHPAGMEEWLHSYTGGHPLLLKEASTARNQWQVQHFLQSVSSWAERTADAAPCSSQDSRRHSCTSKDHVFHIPK